MNPKLVSSIPLFSGVSRRRRALVAALADEVDVAPGTVLTREGGYAGSFYVILDGQADVWKRTGAASTKVASLGQGEFFGEIGIVNRPTRTATVVARTPMRLLVVGARELASLLARFPSVDDAVRVAVAGRTSQAATPSTAGAASA